MFNVNTVPTLPLESIKTLFSKATNWSSVGNQDAGYALTEIQCYGVQFIPDGSSPPKAFGVLSSQEACSALAKQLEPLVKANKSAAFDVKTLPWAAIIQLLLQLAPLIFHNQTP